MSIDPNIVSAANCRRCDGVIEHLPPSAMYCPHCGVALAMSAHELLNIRIRQALRWAMMRLHFRRRRSLEFAGDLDRSRIITGYSNALFTLGWRYERRHNLPEAIRCYFKSSKLGNADAEMRLAPIERDARDDRSDPANAPVPVMPLWRPWTPRPRVDRATQVPNS
jgi:hypothetical protein